MAALTSSLHITSADDTLRSLAERYGLHCWNALLSARGNSGLLAPLPDASIPVGTRIWIPPPARHLLMQRIQVIQRVRAELQRHFEGLGALLEANLDGALPADHRPISEHLVAQLPPLEQKVRQDVLLAHAAARSIVPLNDALALTHFRDRGDLAKFAGGSVDFAGLNWLLLPGILELWFRMWDRGFWLPRWIDQPADVAIRSVSIHLNLVRSKVLQQTDQRLRESLACIADLDRESEGC